MAGRIRTSLAYWLSPLFLAIPFLGLQGPPYTSDPYALALTASATVPVIVLAPLAAMCAAWEGDRLRRARWLDQPRRRGLPRVALAAAAPTVAVATTALFIGVMALTAPLLPTPRVVAQTVLVLWAWILLGFGVGLHVRAVIAMPALVLGGYVWFTLPIALEPLWMRHLGGALFSCCHVDRELDPRATAAVLVVAAGVAVVGALAVALADRAAPTHHLLVGVPVLAASLVVGSLLVDHLGADPDRPRPVADDCTESRPAFCLYPEHADLREDLVALAPRVATWQDLGIEVPPTYEEGGGPNPGHLYTHSSFTPGDTAVAVADATFATVGPVTSTCTQGVRPAARRARQELLAWGALDLGTTATHLRDVLSRPVVAEADKAPSAPTALASWVGDRLELLDVCPPRSAP